MSNAEIRRKPEVRSPNFLFRSGSFGIWTADLFRVSDFEFRIFNRVGQLHDVEEIAFTAPDVKQRQLAGMFTGETLEALNAFELALERAVVLECVPPHDLHRAQDARRAARQPHLAIRTAANAPEKLVVRNGRWKGS